MNAPAVDVGQTWAEYGTQLLLDGMDRLSDAQLDQACTLPGWSRRQLLAHVASNARAVGRLLSWARTGRENRMYDSPGQRAAEIERGAGRADLRDWVRETAAELSRAVCRMPGEAWDVPVVTAQGRTVPAAETSWMRARETCVHAIDLGAGASFADLPEGFLVALVEDVVAWRGVRPGPAVTLRTPLTTYEIRGQGPRREIDLPLADAAAWLVGRRPCHATTPPHLPRWL